MPKRRPGDGEAGGAAIRIGPLTALDYDDMVALWKAAGLTFRPRGRDSRRSITAQLNQPTSMYLKAVVARGKGYGVKGNGDRIQAPRVKYIRISTRIPASITLNPKPYAPGPTEKIVGVVLGSHDGRRGWINRLAVLPGFQKRGVGGMLVKELERRLAKLGLLLVAVQVDRGNRRSLRFFKGLGYRLHDDIHYLSKRKGDWV
jgi:ribosomal protein S18 acetylase RimI-like enzyme